MSTFFVKVIKFRIIFFLILLIGFHSCKSDKKSEEKESIEISENNVIEIITETMDFQAPDTITSGWNTFRYINKSTETHFFLLNKYPDGKTIKDNKQEIIPPFQNGMDLINKGKPKEGFAEFKKLPKWFFDVIYFGGSGLISPKKSSITTLKLKAGYYLIECYVKMPNGKFHTSMGMTKSLVVTNEDSDNTAPKASVNLTISSTAGIVFDEHILKGNQIFSVNFKDQVAHENFVGHDVNLIGLTDGANLKELEDWMNWVNPKGLITPAPKGITFLGGVNEMSIDNTGYFQVNLKPGNYAFISEVPNPSSKNMLKTFVVSE